MNPETKGTACAEYEMLLEDSLEGELEAADAQSLAAHLKTCVSCRAALDDARAALGLLRLAEPTPDPGPQLTHAVMARIRTERQSDERSLARLVAAFARPFALAATLALGIMLAYSAYWVPNRITDAVVVQQTEMRDLISDPAAPPATPDDTLMMVAENEHGK